MMGRDEKTDALVLRPREAAEALGVSKAHVYRMLRQGFMRGRKVGSAWLIPRGEPARIIREVEQMTVRPMTDNPPTPRGGLVNADKLTREGAA